MREYADELLESLNTAQRAAVVHGAGPLLVLAGPGSGKTRVITHRAAYLVERGVQPENILAITFTNKAAREMRDRLHDLRVSHGMWICTYHALCLRLMRIYAESCGVDPGFTIYDDADQKTLVKKAYELCDVATEVVPIDLARWAISNAKNRLETPEQLEQAAEDHKDELIAELYATYQVLLERNNAVDFDDLLMRVARLLREQPEVAQRLNQRFQYLLIDEYQDTNHAQYEIARRLSEHHQNICATGDPDQSIYAWRGADIRNILRFEQDYADATVVRLEQNYRSYQHILRTADRLIAVNRDRKPKTLWSERGDGPPVAVWRFGHGNVECEHIAQAIGQQHAEGRAFSDFAILYRINALSRGLEAALRARRIPYRIARGVAFYNRKEIRDALAYLSAIANPDDTVAFARAIATPPRGIGNTTLQRLLAYADRTGKSFTTVMRHCDQAEVKGAPARRVRAFEREIAKWQQAAGSETVSSLVRRVIDESGLAKHYSGAESGGEDRQANLDELVTSAVRYEEDMIDDSEASLTDFLQMVSLVSDQDAVDEDSGCVMLMTLHTAKGLEFPVVFIVGLEQGMLPHDRALGLEAESNSLEEERRLCFVGITRAQEQAVLTTTQERLLRGKPRALSRSQFLVEMDDPDSVEWSDFGLGMTGRFGGGSRFGGSSRRFGHDTADLWEDGGADELAGLDSDATSFDFGAGAPADEDAARSPAVDDQPGASGAARRRKRSSLQDHDEPVFSLDDETEMARRSRPADRRSDVVNAYQDWSPGMLVRHPSYGIGSLVLIQRGPQTRARIKFPGEGEKTFVLELSPIERVQV